MPPLLSSSRASSPAPSSLHPVQSSVPEHAPQFTLSSLASLKLSPTNPIFQDSPSAKTQDRPTNKTCSSSSQSPPAAMAASSKSSSLPITQFKLPGRHRSMFSAPMGIFPGLPRASTFRGILPQQQSARLAPSPLNRIPLPRKSSTVSSANQSWPFASAFQGIKQLLVLFHSCSQQLRASDWRITARVGGDYFLSWMVLLSAPLQHFSGLEFRFLGDKLALVCPNETGADFLESSDAHDNANFCLSRRLL